MDPLTIPMMALVEPFLVARGGNDEEAFPDK
jgi:hypothetical protein